MGATFSIRIGTCEDYPFSEIATALLNNGLRWHTTLDGEKLYDYGLADESVMGDGYSDDWPEKVILELLDKERSEGKIIAVPLMVGERYRFTLRQSVPQIWDMFVDAGRPELASTWLTDIGQVTNDILLPIVRSGICLTSVTFEDENL